MSTTRLILGLVLLAISPAKAEQKIPIERPVFCTLPEPGFFLDDYPYVKLTITADGTMGWNGASVNEKEFESYLAKTREVMPAFHVVPEPQTPYSIVGPLLLKIEDAGIEWTIIFAGGGREEPIVCTKIDRWKDHMPVIVNLNIKADGTLFWNGAAVTPGQFFQYLAEAAKARPEFVFDVFPDPATKYATLGPILREIQRNRIRDIVLGPNREWIRDELSSPPK